MNITKHCLILASVVLALCACKDDAEKKAMSFPEWPVEEVFVYDTIDCTGIECIPENAITVRKAVEIGKKLASKTGTEERYYIKGVVKGFKEPDHTTGVTSGYHNACIYLQDNNKTSIEFYGYRIKGLNGADVSSLDQIKIGDFVVLACNIYNYNGTIENNSSQSAYLVYTTNEINYPETFQTYFEERFTGSLGAWTTKIVSDDPGVTVWRPDYVESTNVHSALAKAIGTQGEKLASEVWLVSPSIDLSDCTTQDVKLTFNTNYRGSATAGTTAPNVKDMLRLKISKDGSSWDDMEIPNFNSGKTGLYVADTINISAYASANTRIAFAYKSTTNFAPDWKVTDITIGERKRALVCK